MAKAKKYWDLDDQERSDMQWFFAATRNPEMKPFIFSRASMEKQIEGSEESHCMDALAA